MRIEVHHYFHSVIPDPRIEEILAAVRDLKGAAMTVQDAIARLTEKVSRIESVGDSAVELIKGLADQIRQTAGNEAAVNELADRVEAQASEIAQAITDNTPA